MAKPKAKKGELTELPDGTCVYFVEEDHSYWRCKPDWSRGKRYTGVTSAIKPIDYDPGRLLNWAARTQLLGVAELAAERFAEADQMPPGPTDLSWLMAQDSIWRELEAAKLTFEHVRDQAAQRGTNVHEGALRRLAETGQPPDYEGLSEEERGYAKAVTSFWLDHNPNPLQWEQLVADEELGVAGTFDLRADLEPCGVEECGCAASLFPSLIDAKTSRWIGRSHHVQLAAYGYLAAGCGIGESSPLLILQLRPDGSYSLIPARASSEDFLAALDVYRRAAEIDKQAKKDRERSAS